MSKPSRHSQLCALLVLLLCSAGRAALAQVRYELLEGSRLWIEGRSNVNRFSCGATLYDLEAEVQPGDTNEPVTREDVTVTVAIAMHGFECGNHRMERDLAQALSADRFPEIRFAFIAARHLPVEKDSDGARRLQVWGDLTVAGVRRGVDFVVIGSHEAQGKVRARGSITIRMTDYGIDPPRRLLGLVRVRDRLTVQFDLVLEPSRQTALHMNENFPPRP